MFSLKAIWQPLWARIERRLEIFKLQLKIELAKDEKQAGDDYFNGRITRLEKELSDLKANTAKAEAEEDHEG